MTKQQFGKITKIAVLIYVASFLIINWNDISWLFNYRMVTGLVNGFFTPYPSSAEISSKDAYFYPNHTQEESAQTILLTQASSQTSLGAKTSYTDKQNTIEIPKISISVPIVFSSSSEKSAIEKDLDAGVVFYPGSVYPGQKGRMTVLGHSAPPGWPKIKHDWVFSQLNELKEGDKILIDLNNKQYSYTVKKRVIIEKGADVPIDSALADTNVLELISCWPPGKDYQRIAVIAVLDT